MKNSNIYLNEGKEYMFNNDYYSAIEIFNKGLNISYDPIFNFYIAICLYKIEDYNSACNYLKKYEIDGTHDIEICYILLSSIYIKLNELETAYYYYQKFLGKEDKNIDSKLSSNIIKNYNCIIENRVNKVLNNILIK